MFLWGRRTPVARLALPAAALLAAAAGCSGAAATSPRAGRRTHSRMLDVDAAAAAGPEADAGAGGAPAVAERDAARAGPAVSADAGVASAELAWLVSHIGDNADRANAYDSDNVRALAARGAEGVRAVSHIFRHADAPRVPFARRVVERVALRACRRTGRESARRLVLWIELGRLPDNVLDATGAFAWTRAEDQMWPREAVARLVAWADAALPCGPPPGAPDRADRPLAPEGDPDAHIRVTGPEDRADAGAIPDATVRAAP